MSDGKVPLVYEWKAWAQNIELGSAYAQAKVECADELEQFWPVVERLIAAGQACRDRLMKAQNYTASDAEAWDAALAAYQAGRNGK